MKKVDIIFYLYNYFKALYLIIFHLYCNNFSKRKILYLLTLQYYYNYRLRYKNYLNIEPLLINFLKTKKNNKTQMDFIDINCIVELLSSVSYKSSCYTKAFLKTKLLIEHRYIPTFYIGYKKNDNNFEAHSWISIVLEGTPVVLDANLMLHKQYTILYKWEGVE